VTAHVRRSRRNTAVLAATAATVGLLFLFPTSTNRSSTPRRPGQALAPAGIVAVPTPSSSAKAQATPAPQHVDVRVNGTSIDTRYGPVQVQIHVRDRHLISATAIDYPQSSGRDQEINSQAVPALENEAVQAQNAHIDTISGATYTSDGYRQSLQSALDLAHLA
jgi:uncharacterized protein with FMN-binding domain